MARPPSWLHFRRWVGRPFCEPDGQRASAPRRLGDTVVLLCHGCARLALVDDRMRQGQPARLCLTGDQREALRRTSSRAAPATRRWSRPARVTGFDHRDSIRQRPGLAQIVRHEEDGAPALVEKLAKQGNQVAPQRQVDVGEWLVEQKRGGIGGQRACQGHTLPFTAGELRREAAPPGNRRSPGRGASGSHHAAVDWVRCRPRERAKFAA